ncbi:hypothetical protein [Spirillospora sp. CA-294931]|uniref:hypothetical protein n=1 Tax=Spirillospora sp. CA-294931 TaxID=3240042 RepID=UPI003D93B17E
MKQPILRVTAVTAVVALALAGCGGSDGKKKSKSKKKAVAAVPAKPGPDAESPAPGPGAKVLGPSGLGKLRLGMSVEDAQGTGELGDKKATGGGACTGFGLRAYPTPGDSVSLYASQRDGIAVIFAPRGVKTPEGLKVGSPAAAVRRAYPKAERTPSGWVANVPGGSRAQFLFTLNGKSVSEIGLASTRQDCVG